MLSGGVVARITTGRAMSQDGSRFMIVHTGTSKTDVDVRAPYAEVVVGPSRGFLLVTWDAVLRRGPVCTLVLADIRGIPCHFVSLLFGKNLRFSIPPSLSGIGKFMFDSQKHGFFPVVVVALRLIFLLTGCCWHNHKNDPDLA